ncbi:MAG: efflux RND transporter periplasmic adaptor subunit [Chromatiales bacterium]|nr:efflux RND transporter periplasmic adaptor subunit [Chromatiales bacterium]
MRKWIASLAGTAVLLVLAWNGWQHYLDGLQPTLVASGNGRIDATEVDVATRLPGRLSEVLVNEGAMVTAGQIVARMDTDELHAQLREANARLLQTKQGERYAEAIVKQRQSELTYARNEYGRSSRLSNEGHVSVERLDQDRNALTTAEAALQAANVQVLEAQAAIEAARAAVDRIQSNIDDSVLVSPIDGRVLYRLAEPGEVLAAGGRVVTVLDLTDVFMTIFLPTQQAGRVTVGDEARIILDALPDYVVPAQVSFVDPQAQFTPREVETRSEREKLMFRIKVKIDPGLLKEHVQRVKTGIPGEAYLRLDSAVQWPEQLKVRLP